MQNFLLTLKPVVYCFRLKHHNQNGLFCLKFLHILATSVWFIDPNWISTTVYPKKIPLSEKSSCHEPDFIAFNFYCQFIKRCVEWCCVLGNVVYQCFLLLLENFFKNLFYWFNISEAIINRHIISVFITYSEVRVFISRRSIYDFVFFSMCQ